jgi:hypothetical protein
MDGLSRGARSVLVQRAWCRATKAEISRVFTLQSSVVVDTYFHRTVVLIAASVNADPEVQRLPAEKCSAG